jgi:protein-disulfide isomerase
VPEKEAKGMRRQPLIVGIVLAVVGVLLSVPAVIPAEVEWTTLGQLDLKTPPLDISVSADGKWLYILCPGEIAIYSFNEDKIVNRIPVDQAVDRMIYVKEKNALLVSSRSGDAVRIIQLEVVNTFTTSGLPYKGPKSAPITIAVFSDYQ